MVDLYGRRGGEFLINTNTAGNQSSAHVATLPGGGFIVVWVDGSTVGGDPDFGIKAQRFDSAGNKVGDEFLVNTATAGVQTTPQVAVLPSGRFVITWTDQSGLGTPAGIEVKGQFFAADGTRIGAEFMVNTATAGNQLTPAVTELAGGGFVVAWTDGSGQGGDTIGSGIKAQLFDANGAKVGSEFLVNTTIEASQVNPSVIALPGGGFAVGWNQTFAVFGSVQGAVRVQMFDAAGSKVGGEKLVSSIPDGNFSGTKLAALSTGFVAVWAQQDSPSWPGVPVTFDIRGQRYDAAGNKLGGEFVVNTATQGSQTFPDVAALPDGRFIVVWQGEAGTAGFDVYGQIYSAAGGKVGAEFVLSSVNQGNQGTPRVEVLPSGEIVLVWTDGSGIGGDSSGSAIKAQVLTLASDPPTDILLSTTAISETAREGVPLATFRSLGAVNSTFSYELLSDSTGGAFAIDGDRLVVRDNSLLDFERSSVTEIRVRTTDLNGRSYEETIRLDITDTQEAGYSPTDQILVNASTEGDQSQPTIIALAGGGFLSLWYQSPLSGYGWPDGMARIFDGAGNPVTDEFELPAGSAVALPDGGFLIVGGEPYGNAIAARFYDSLGRPTGPAIPVNAPTADELVDAKVGLLANGGFVVSWTELFRSSPFGSADPNVKVQIFDPQGAKVGPEFYVHANLGGSQYLADVVSLSGGGFLISWSDGSAFRVQLFTASGERLGQPVALETDNSPIAEPQVTALAGGGYVITWSQNTSSGGWVSLNDLTAQVFDANGIPVGSEILIADNGPAQVNSTAVIGLGWGGFIVVWLDHDGPPSFVPGLRAQVFDATGAKVGPEYSVNDFTAGEQFHATVAELASGALAIGWTERGGTGGDGSGMAVVARLYTPISIIEGTAADDILVGTALEDTINGYDGNDYIDGGGDADRMVGGAGNDVYIVDHPGDVVVEHPGEGVDEVRTTLASYSLAGTQIENLTGLGDLDQILTGNNFDNVIDGGAGADTMTGGRGNDVYIVDHVGDVVVEQAAQGRDEVRTSLASYSLVGTEIEDLTGLGEIDQVLTGNAYANVIDGGAGADRMIGGDGNDTYHVDNAGDRVIETSAAGGIDRVFSSVSFALGANVEHLTLTGTADAYAMGNALANTLVGNAGANVLNGHGGADTMIGGAGDDIYVVDDAGDRVIETSADDGVDLVKSSVSYVLGAHLENLTLVGNAAIDGTGNALDNVIIGNAAANVLNGRAGADLMRGGGGDDIYIVDDVGDRVIEGAASHGHDTVLSSVSFTLGAHVEDLKLTGSAAIDGIGNALANVIHGNSAANLLKGGGGDDMLHGGAGDDTLHGGAGFDTLRGASGADRFVFDSALGPANVDTILDFARGLDKIVLENGIFKGLAEGALAANAFVVGAAATTAQHRIVYDPTTGALFYDADGSGAGAAVQFATLANMPATLAASDFAVI